MLGLLADVNIEGLLKRVIDVCESEAWHEIWEYCGADVVNFEEFGLTKDASDRLIWQRCQERNVILITANRNKDGDDSLSATIMEFGGVNDLPVLTVADSRRFSHDSRYVERVAIRLMDILSDLDRYRGAGRMFLP